MEADLWDLCIKQYAEYLALAGTAEATGRNYAARDEAWTEWRKVEHLYREVVKANYGKER